MEKQSKILLIVFIFLILTSLSIAYYKYIYKGDVVYFTDSQSVPDGFVPIQNILNKI